MRVQMCALLAGVCLLAGPSPGLAQLQSGNITGRVTDEQGAVLPGATVTLTSSDRTLTFSTEEDGQFRFLNLAPGTYKVSVSQQGFTTAVRERVLVTVGSNVDLRIHLPVATVVESVMVSAEAPVIDTKAMGTATNFTQAELAKVPNSRDPWALLRTVPGVVLDRVNIAGNETGQQSGYTSKGAGSASSAWTLDGVQITDMAAIGASPTYFDYDAFDEIQISTAGNDIKQPTGGVGLNFVVKRGTNQFRGTARGYFTNDSLESTNLPAEMRDRGITPESSDHNDQIADYGGDVGGPIFREKAWFFASWTKQDIRLVRSAGNLIDRTLLTTTNVKGNWQATEKDMVSVLWFNGVKEKFGRATGNAQVEPASARWTQGGAYPEGKPHGLLKFQDDRVFSPRLFLSVKYAWYGTGFSLSPAGGLDQPAGISARLGQTFGSTVDNQFLRPMHIFNADGNYFLNALGGAHDFKYGVGYRRAQSFAGTTWPGDMIVAYDNSVTDKRARLYRGAAGTDQTEYFQVYLGDVISFDRLTIDVGARFDRQWGSALASNTASNKAFGDLVPGIQFQGYDAPFTWQDVSPRIGMTLALDESRRTLLRASVSRGVGQLATGTVGYSNPSASAGWVEYPWVDHNGDNLAQPDEVHVDRSFITFGGGFNPAAPTEVTSANRIDPGLEAPKTTSVVIGLDRELMSNLAVQVNYSFNRGTHATYTPWIGLTPADYAAGVPVTGTLPGGEAFSVPTFLPDAALITANGNSRILTNYAGYATKYHGVEASVIKRMSGRWMMRLAVAYNNPTEEYSGNPPVNGAGNPTALDVDRLIDGGQFAPRSAGSGAGDIFINGKWQVNLNGAYQLPWDLEVAGNLFGRQGNPYPLFRTAALGRDGSNRVHVTPALDALRFDDLWNLDLRIAKSLRARRLNVQIVGDLFNVFNSNTELQRERNLASPNFNRLNSILSPRILRVGMRVGF